MRAAMFLAARRPPCMATWATCGSGLPSLPADPARSPMTKTSGWPGRARSGPTVTWPPRPCSTPSESARGAARTPATHTAVADGMKSPSVRWTPSAVTDATDALQPHLDAPRLQDLAGVLLRRHREAVEEVVGHLHQHDVGPPQPGAGVVLGQHHVEQLDEGAGQLHPGRPAAGDDHRERPLVDQGRVAGGPLELAQDVVAQAHRRGQGLEGEGVVGHAGHAEVGRHRPRGQHQVVVGQAAAVVELDVAGVEVDRLHRGHRDLHVRLVPDDGAHAVGDVVGRQPGGGHLVEEGPEAVVVVAVDEGDVDREGGQGPGGAQPAEACSHDDDAWSGRSHATDHPASAGPFSTWRPYPVATRAAATCGRARPGSDVVPPVSPLPPGPAGNPRMDRLVLDPAAIDRLVLAFGDDGRDVVAELVATFLAEARRCDLRRGRGRDGGRSGRPFAEVAPPPWARSTWPSCAGRRRT